MFSKKLVVRVEGKDFFSSLQLGVEECPSKYLPVVGFALTFKCKLV